MSITAAPAARFVAARIDGRYRVQGTVEGQIVATLSSKAKAEAKAEALNGEAELLAMVEADVAMEEAMDAECPQEEEIPAEFAAVAEGEVTVVSEEIPEEEEPVIVLAGQAAPLAEQDAPIQDAAPAAEEPQDAPAEPAGTEDTPAPAEELQSAAQPVEAKTVKGKIGPNPHAGKAQPEPHAFTTVGTTVKNHCTDCGRTWAAAAHRKFREQQEIEVAEVAEDTSTEGEWTPAADDTTEDGKAPAEERAAE